VARRTVSKTAPRLAPVAISCHFPAETERAGSCRALASLGETQFPRGYREEHDFSSVPPRPAGSRWSPPTPMCSRSKSLVQTIYPRGRRDRISRKSTIGAGGYQTHARYLAAIQQRIGRPPRRGSVFRTADRLQDRNAAPAARPIGIDCSGDPVPCCLPGGGEMIDAGLPFYAALENSACDRSDRPREVRGSCGRSMLVVDDAYTPGFDFQEGRGCHWNGYASDSAVFSPGSLALRLPSLCRYTSNASITR
jgi:hypothetical protein